MTPPRGTSLVAIVWLLAAALAPARAVADEQHQVLVFYSARRDAQVSAVGERELPRLLEKGVGGRLDYYSEFIDPSRFPDVDYQKALGVFVREKYENQRFDLIIAVGEDATGFVGRHQKAFQGAPPIVFYGATRGIEAPRNSTGVIGELDLTGTVSLAARLDPALQHVFVVGGADSNDRSLQRIAETQLRRFEPDLEITYLAGLRTGDLEQKLRHLPPHSMVFYLVVGQDGDGQFVHPLKYLERIIAAANAPTYTWVDSGMGLGIVGGNLKSQTAQMQVVAELALRVMRGESVDSIPVEYRNLNVTQVDWRQVRRWGLDERRLPAGAIVLFREPTAWERYRAYILTGLLLLTAQSVLIGGLLLNRRRRHKAEAQLLDSQAELRASYDRIRDLGGRLLSAQESERSHIARELHDDVSQQLALVEMDLKLLGSGQRSDTEELVTESLSRVQAVGRSLRELSHQLHPAKLRLIGLPVALKGLQREMSQSGVEVVFTDEGVPPTLAPELTVCVFRVAQEALQNAVKYSRAGRIAVRLAGADDTLTLTIEDDGVGFDIPAMWGKGLGLVSMMERVDAIGGDMKIRSEPGSGTRLDVVLPLNGERAGPVAV